MALKACPKCSSNVKWKVDGTKATCKNCGEEYQIPEPLKHPYGRVLKRYSKARYRHYVSQRKREFFTGEIVVDFAVLHKEDGNHWELVASVVDADIKLRGGDEPR